MPLPLATSPLKDNSQGQEGTIHKLSVNEKIGYADTVFEGKHDQMLKVSAHIAEKGFIPKELVENEVAWFYGNLGIDDQYFRLESVETIAMMILKQKKS